MQIVKKTPAKIILKTEGNYSLINAIRRSMEEVLTLAVDEVEIFKNDSALFDEMLAHRIGLVPLKMEGKFSNKTSVDLKISKVGPCVVYSGDLVGGVDVVYKNMPLTILEKGQELEIVATAKLGKGLEHAKYSPGFIFYKNLYEVKVNNKEIEKIIQNSKSELEGEKKGSSWKGDLTDAEADEISKIDSEAIKTSDELLVFIESFGQQEAEDIFLKAIESLSVNLEEFEENFK